MVRYDNNDNEDDDDAMDERSREWGHASVREAREQYGGSIFIFHPGVNSRYASD